MNDLQIFKNDLFEIAVKLDNGEYLFDLEKVAISLGFTDNQRGKLYVRWNRINEYLKPFAISGENEIEYKKGDLIPEAAVYKLAFKASNEVAEKFQNWLAIEVLPQIRKTGAYMDMELIKKYVYSPEFLIKVGTELKAKDQKINQLETKIEVDKPKVLFADSVTASKDTILIRELSKYLTQNGVKNMGQNKLFQWLREKGYLIIKNGSDYNTPTQRAMDMGLFEVETSTINRSDGIMISKTTKVTGKGRLYFLNKFLNVKSNDEELKATLPIYPNPQLKMEGLLNE